MERKNQGILYRSMPEALRADFKHAQREHAMSADSLAVEFDKSREWVYQVIRGEIAFSLVYLRRWCELTGGENLARYLADQMGLLYVPKPQHTEGSVTELTDVMRSNNDSVVACVEVFGDGKITPDELPRAYEALALLDAAVESELELKETIQADIARCLDALKNPSSLSEFEAEQRKKRAGE